MKLGTKQGFCFCMVISMILSNYSAAVAQDLATVNSSPIRENYYSEVKALNIGDQVPDLQFQNVLNYKAKTAKLSDFKGKLVILDMWSTSCTACISGFVKMQKLQNEFDGKIQILLVNPHTFSNDSEEKVKSVLA